MAKPGIPIDPIDGNPQTWQLFIYLWAYCCSSVWTGWMTWPRQTLYYRRAFIPETACHTWWFWPYWWTSIYPHWFYWFQLLNPHWAGCMVVVSYYSILFYCVLLPPLFPGLVLSNLLLVCGLLLCWRSFLMDGGWTGKFICSQYLLVVPDYTFPCLVETLKNYNLLIVITWQRLIVILHPQFPHCWWTYLPYCIGFQTLT